MHVFQRECKLYGNFCATYRKLGHSRMINFKISFEKILPHLTEIWHHFTYQWRFKKIENWKIRKFEPKTELKLASNNPSQTFLARREYKKCVQMQMMHMFVDIWIRVGWAIEHACVHRTKKLTFIERRS